VVSFIDVTPLLWDVRVLFGWGSTGLVAGTHGTWEGALGREPSESALDGRPSTPVVITHRALSTLGYPTTDGCVS
jgi:hypothetical protein